VGPTLICRKGLDPRGFGDVPVRVREQVARRPGASGLECDDFIGPLLVVLFYVCSRTFLRLHWFSFDRYCLSSVCIHQNTRIHKVSDTPCNKRMRYLDTCAHTHAHARTNTPAAFEEGVERRPGVPRTLWHTWDTPIHTHIYPCARARALSPTSSI